MRDTDIVAIIRDEHPDCLLMDDYDDCIIGICHSFGHEPRVAYDRSKVIKKLMAKDNMTEEEATEFHEFNQAGAYVGETTPVFIETFNGT
jgi:hypothetical protein